MAILAILSTATYLLLFNKTSETRNAVRQNSIQTIASAINSALADGTLRSAPTFPWTCPEGSGTTDCSELGGTPFTYDNMKSEDQIALRRYLPDVPMDPQTEAPYIYAKETNSNNYRVYSVMEDTKDNGKTILVSAGDWTKGLTATISEPFIKKVSIPVDATTSIVANIVPKKFDDTSGCSDATIVCPNNWREYFLLVFANAVDKNTVLSSYDIGQIWNTQMVFKMKNDGVLDPSLNKFLVYAETTDTNPLAEPQLSKYLTISGNQAGLASPDVVVNGKNTGATAST